MVCFPVTDDCNFCSLGEELNLLKNITWCMASILFLSIHAYLRPMSVKNQTKSYFQMITLDPSPHQTKALIFNAKLRDNRNDNKISWFIMIYQSNFWYNEPHFILPLAVVSHEAFECLRLLSVRNNCTSITPMHKSSAWTTLKRIQLKWKKD